MLCFYHFYMTHILGLKLLEDVDILLELFKTLKIIDIKRPLSVIVKAAETYASGGISDVVQTFSLNPCCF